jgi:hypothetical protein
MEAVPSFSWTASDERSLLQSSERRSGLEPRLAAAETSLAAERSQLTSAERRLTEHEHSFSQLWQSSGQEQESDATRSPQSRLELVQSVLALLQKTNQAFERVNAAYEEIIALTKQRIELAGAGVPQEERAIRALLRRLSEQEATRQRYQRERETLQQQLVAWQQLTRAVEPARLKLEKIREEIEWLREENAQLESRLKSANADSQQLAEELSSLEHQIEADEQVLRQAQRQRDDQRTRLQMLSEANTLQADLLSVLRTQERVLHPQRQPISADPLMLGASASAASAQQQQNDSSYGSHRGQVDSKATPAEHSDTMAKAPAIPNPLESVSEHRTIANKSSLLSESTAASITIAPGDRPRDVGRSVRRARASAARETSSSSSSAAGASWRKQPLAPVAPADGMTVASSSPKTATSPVRLMAESLLREVDDIEALAVEPQEPRTPLSKLRRQGQGSSWETLQHLSPPATTSSMALTASLPASSSRADALVPNRTQRRASVIIRGECFNNRTLTAVVSGLENASSPRVQWYRLSRRSETLSSYAFRYEASRYRTTADDVGMRLAAVVEAPGTAALRSLTEVIQVAPDMEERLSGWMLEGRAAFLVQDEASGAPRSILVSKRHIKVQRPVQQRRAAPPVENMSEAADDFDPREGHWITEEKKSWSPFIKVVLDETDSRSFVLTLDHTFAFRSSSTEQRDLITLSIRQFALRYRSGSSAQRHECRMQ